MKITDKKKYWKSFYDSFALLPMPEHRRLLFGSLKDVLRQRKVILEEIRKYFEGSCGFAVDIGCGTGRYLEALSSNGWVTIGLDFSFPLLREARCNNIPYLAQAVGEDIPIKSKQADLVLCIEMLQTSDAPENVIAEAYRLLKPGGMFVLATLRRLVVYELCFYPLTVLVESDRGLKNVGWYQKLIKARDVLVWPNRPVHNPIRRHSVKYLYGLLKEAGFKNISRQYLGKVKYVPYLFNSQSVIIIAKKEEVQN